MKPIPPRIVTLEHEAAHAVVARIGGGSVAYIDVGIAQLSPTRYSLGRTKWQPGQGHTNTLTAGYVAGPAQTKVTVQRDALAVDLIDSTIEAEALDLNAVLQNRGHGVSQSVAEQLIRTHLPVVEA